MEKDYQTAQVEYGLSAQRLNVDFGHSPTSSWAYQLIHGDATITLPQLGQWIASTGGRETVRYFAGLAGLGVHPVETKEAVELNIANLGKECNEAAGALFAALEDGVVTDAELNNGLRELDEAEEAIQKAKVSFIARHRETASGNARTIAGAEQWRKAKC